MGTVYESDAESGEIMMTDDAGPSGTVYNVRAAWQTLLAILPDQQAADAVATWVQTFDAEVLQGSQCVAHLTELLQLPRLAEGCALAVAHAPYLSQSMVLRWWRDLVTTLYQVGLPGVAPVVTAFVETLPALVEAVVTANSGPAGEAWSTWTGRLHVLASALHLLATACALDPDVDAHCAAHVGLRDALVRVAAFEEFEVRIADIAAYSDVLVHLYRTRRVVLECPTVPREFVAALNRAATSQTAYCVLTVLETLLHVVATWIDLAVPPGPALQQVCRRMLTWANTRERLTPDPVVLKLLQRLRWLCHEFLG